MAKVPTEPAKVIKPVVQKQKWSLMKKISVVIGAIVVFILGIFIIASMATSAPLKVSDEFIADVKSGDSAAGYDLMSNGAKEVTSPDDLKTAIDRVGPILTGKAEVQSKEVSAETGKASTAKVVYKIAGSDDINYIVTVNLIEENKQWKVLNFESDKE